MQRRRSLRGPPQMNRSPGVLIAVARHWAGMRPRGRLLVGGLIIALIGLSGLTPHILFGSAIAWPYAALIGAVGWGRSGFGFGPMVLLVVFGLAQDVTASAPIGCFALINLLTYGMSAGLFGTFDTERSPVLADALPVVALTAGFALVWLMASVSGNHAVRAAPILSAGLMTALLQFLILPLYDLGIKHTSTGGGARA